MLKALAKEPERRYQSAGNLGEDIQRLLEGQPIEAKRDSALYVLRKQLRRYRVPVGIAALVLVFLAVSSIALTIMYRGQVHEHDRADRERDKAILAEQMAKAERDRAIEAERKAQEAAGAARRERDAKLAAQQGELDAKTEQLAAAQRRQRASMKYEEAVDLIRRGVLPEQALGLIDDALEIDTEFALAHFERGRLRLAMRRTCSRQEQEGLLARVLTDFVNAHMAMGGDWLVDPESGERIPPESLSSLAVDGSDRLVGFPDVHRQADGRCMRERPDGTHERVGGPGFPRALVAAGDALRDADRLAEASRYYRRAERLDPDSVYVRLAKAWLQWRAGASGWQSALQGLNELANHEIGCQLYEVWFALGYIHGTDPTFSGRSANPAFDPEAAERALRRCVDLNPREPLAWNGLGNVLVRLGRREEAVVAYRQAVELDPTSVASWANLALTLDHLNRAEEADEAYRQALAIPADHVADQSALGTISKDALQADSAVGGEMSRWVYGRLPRDPWSNLGYVLLARKRHEQAISAFQNALLLRPDQKSWSELANALHQGGRVEEAYEALHEAVRRLPSDPDAWNVLAYQLALDARPDEARDAYFHALEVDPEFAAGWTNLLRMVCNRPSPGEDVWRAARKAVSSRPDWPHSWLTLTRCWANHDAVRTEAVIRDLLEAHPAAAWGWHGLGDLLLAQERNEEAVNAYRHATDLEPEDSGHWLGYAQAIGRVGPPGRATTVVRRWLELHPRDANAWDYLAVLLEQQGDLNGHLEALQRAAQLEPASHRLAHLATAEASYGAVEDARQHLAAALARARNETGSQPDSAQAWARLGSILEGEFHYEEAVGAFRQASDLDPVWNISVGRLLTNQGHFIEAEERLRCALACYGQTGLLADEDARYAVTELARCLCKQERRKDALAEIQSARDVAPQSYLLVLGLADTLLSEGDAAGAAEAYRRATELRPMDWRGWLGLAEALIALEQWVEAHTVVDHLVQVRPGSPAGWRRLGNLLEAEGRAADASRAYERATAAAQCLLDLCGNHVESRIWLSGLLRKQGKPEAEVALLRTLCERHPGEPLPWHHLLLALDEREDDAAAEHVCEDIRTRFTNDAVALELLARHYDRRRNWGRAAETWRCVVELRPRSAYARHRLIRSLHGCGRDDELATNLSELTALDSDDPVVSIAAARVFSDIGLTTVAATELKKLTAAYDLSSDVGQRLFATAICHCSASGLTETAIRLAASELVALSRVPHAAGLDILAFRLRCRMGATTASRICEHAVRLAPEDAQLEHLWAGLLLECGRTEDAIRIERQVTKIAPDCGPAWRRLADTLASVGNVPEALEAYRRVVVLMPRDILAREAFSEYAQTNDAEALFVASLRASLKENPVSATLRVALSDELWAAGRKEEAKRVLGGWREVPCDTLTGHRLLARRCEHRQMDDDAAELFRHLSMREPHNYWPIHRIGKIRQLQKRYDEAIVLFRQALALRPDYYDSLRRLGEVLTVQRRWQEALEVFDMASESHPGDCWTLWAKGQALSNAGRINEALVCYAELAERDPAYHSHQAWRGMAGLLERKGQLDRAYKLYSDASTLYPDDYWLLYRMGRIRRSQARYDEAVALLQRSLALRPDYQHSLIEIGEVLLEQGKWQEAIEHFREMIELRPENAEVLNGVAWTLLTSDVSEYVDDLDPVTLAERAVAVDGYYSPALNTLGLAYLRAGRYENAIAACKRSITLDGENAWDFLFIAMAQCGMGQIESGRANYERAKSLSLSSASSTEQWEQFRQECEAMLRAAGVMAQENP